MIIMKEDNKFVTNNCVYVRFDMLFIPLQHLRSGMTLGKTVFCGMSVNPLITAGQIITSNVIQKLVHYGVSGVYVESKFCSDIEPEDLISTEFKGELVLQLKDVYKSYMGQGNMTALGNQAVKMADMLLTAILNKTQHLLNVVEIKHYDNYTFSHSICVGTLAALIGIKMGYARPVLEELTLSGLMHDIGKLNVPIEIINKPGKLDTDEFTTLKQHPALGLEHLRLTPNIPPAVLAGIHTHHEQYNGDGYPFGLKGNKIPLYGRILAIADVYDALTSARSYRRAWYPHEALEHMMGSSGTHFDHELLCKFLKVVAAYPIGTIVKLSNGEVGVVTHNEPDYPMRPEVKIMTPATKLGQIIDMSHDYDYLSVTVTGVADESVKLPWSLF